MLLALRDFPPAWAMLAAIVLLIFALLFRWHYALSLGGRLNVFLVPLFAYIGFVVCLSIFRIPGFGDPALLSLALRICSFLIIFLLGLINLLTGLFERDMRHELERLGIQVTALA